VWPPKVAAVGLLFCCNLGPKGFCNVHPTGIHRLQRRGTPTIPYYRNNSESLSGRCPFSRLAPTHTSEDFSCAAGRDSSRVWNCLSTATLQCLCQVIYAAVAWHFSGKMLRVSVFLILICCVYTTFLPNEMSWNVFWGLDWWLFAGPSCLGLTPWYGSNMQSCGYPSKWRSMLAGYPVGIVVDWCSAYSCRWQHIPWIP
jgi:hypothetical protein